MKINIPSFVFEKIMFWVDKADFEVSGFGNVMWNGTDFDVVDAILLKQHGGATHTDIDALSLSKAQYELRNTPGDLRFWWHSHVNMNTFMSGTDVTTIKELGSQGWAVASVFNKRREITSAISYTQATPFGATSTVYEDKITTVIRHPALSEAVKTELAKQFDDNVTKGYAPYKSTTTAYGGHKPGKFDHWTTYTWYEREGAEALGMTPKTMRNLLNTASATKLLELEADINAYWIGRRGYIPFKASGTTGASTTALTVVESNYPDPDDYNMAYGGEDYTQQELAALKAAHGVYD